MNQKRRPNDWRKMFTLTDRKENKMLIYPIINYTTPALMETMLMMMQSNDNDSGFDNGVKEILWGKDDD